MDHVKRFVRFAREAQRPLTVLVSSRVSERVHADAGALGERLLEVADAREAFQRASPPAVAFVEGDGAPELKPGPVLVLYSAARDPAIPWGVVVAMVVGVLVVLIILFG